LKQNLISDFFLVIPQKAKDIVYNKTYGFVEEVYDVEFDETNGSQVEDENLDDVRGAKLEEAMKYMALGDIRPREAQTQVDDSIQANATSICASRIHSKNKIL
jgi:hypothetical protein